jgi:Asp-tRNA(Asn)/Glu-tRNA(Gln) amidotransferase C subunit
MASEPVLTESEVRLLVRLAGLGLRDEDVGPLTAVLHAHFGLVEVLDQADVSDYEPDLRFDARWH